MSCRAMATMWQLVLVQNAGHGFKQIDPSLQINPGIPQLQSKIVNFLVANLEQ
ncbi:MAG: hypothetical protein ACRECH_00760 [Nitrososphaerales archaeon]